MNLTLDPLTIAQSISDRHGLNWTPASLQALLTDFIAQHASLTAYLLYLIEQARRETDLEHDHG